MSENNTLSAQEKQDGWQLLFDGEDASKNWRGFKKENLPSGWKTVDGTLHRAEKGGDIISLEKFKDIELSLEWKNEGVGNSGVFFRVGEGEEQIFHTGPEYQIINNERRGENGTEETKTGANYALHAPAKDCSNPLGEWNLARIIVKGNHVEHWLNGEKVVEYELGGEDWEKRVANSKFSQWPNYGKLKEGHLALQDHGDPVWFRNIKVKRL